jgi:hypothetical protein
MSECRGCAGVAAEFAAPRLALEPRQPQPYPAGGRLFCGLAIDNRLVNSQARLL